MSLKQRRRIISMCMISPLYSFSFYSTGHVKLTQLTMFLPLLSIIEQMYVHVLNTTNIKVCGCNHVSVMCFWSDTMPKYLIHPLCICNSFFCRPHVHIYDPYTKHPLWIYVILQTPSTTFYFHKQYARLRPIYQSIRF